MHAELVVQELCECYAAILDIFKGFRFSLVEEWLCFGITQKYRQNLGQLSISRSQVLVGPRHSFKALKSSREYWWFCIYQASWLF